MPGKLTSASADALRLSHLLCVLFLPRSLTVVLCAQIQVMKSISHPNVVNLLDVMVSKTNIYLVLELVSGGELFAKLGTPPAPRLS